MRLIELSGTRFGRLTVLHRAGTQTGMTTWRCRCACGAETIVRSDALRRARATVSCGCYGKSKATTHGLSKRPEYLIWKSMRKRCLNACGKDRRNYQERGITVTPKWKSFEAFLADVGPRPSLQHSLDRFPDNDGPYAPGNVRWATADEQALNRRPRRSLYV